MLLCLATVLEQMERLCSGNRIEAAVRVELAIDALGV
jgi:hypothetical protein